MRGKMEDKRSVVNSSDLDKALKDLEDLRKENVKSVRKLAEVNCKMEMLRVQKQALKANIGKCQRSLEYYGKVFQDLEKCLGDLEQRKLNAEVAKLYNEKNIKTALEQRRHFLQQNGSKSYETYTKHLPISELQRTSNQLNEEISSNSTKIKDKLNVLKALK